MLVAHVVTAVVDKYVDIRWWQALVPVGATYEPLWLGLGTLSLDLVAAVTVTSLLRTRLGHRSWRTVHLLLVARLGVGRGALGGHRHRPRLARRTGRRAHRRLPARRCSWRSLYACRPQRRSAAARPPAQSVR